MKIEYQLRYVEYRDRQLLYQWVTDKTVRKNSFQSGEISDSEHMTWFEKHINAEQCDMFILEYENNPIGQIRIDWEGNCGEIDYSIALGYRGMGHGTRILRMLENKIKKNSVWLSAKVKKENIASSLIFEHSGYSKKVENGYILYTKYIE